MAQDIKVKVRLDDGQFKSQLNENDSALDNFSNSVSEASQKVSEAAQKQVRAAEGMGNYRRELRNTVKSIQNLSFAYAELSDADKQSDVGRAMLARLNELKQRGAELKDTITDINNEIKNMASDTSGFDALRESIKIGSSIMSAFVSSMLLADTETELLEAMMKKLAQIYTISNALITVGNALQKESAIMSKLRTAQNALLTASEKLKTAATNKGTAATVAYTIAQKAANAVAKANPYLLLATAILAAGTAIYAYVKKTNEAAEAEKKQKEALQKVKEETEHYSDVMGNAIGDAVGKYKTLQASYKACKNEHEKRQWIKENKSALDQMGLAIKNVNDADRAFLANSDKVIRALRLRAEATALNQLYMEQYKEYMKNNLNKTVENGRVRVVAKAGDEIDINSEEAKKAGLKADKKYYKYYTTQSGTATGGIVTSEYRSNEITPYAAKLINQQRNAAGRAIWKAEEAKLNTTLNELTKKEEEARKAEKEANITRKGSGSTDTKSTAKPGSYKYLLDKQSKFESDVQEGRVVMSKEQLQKKRDEMQKEIDKKAIEIGIEPEPTSITGLEKQINQLKDKMNKGTLTISVDEAKQHLKDLEEQLRELKIQADIEPKKDSVAALEKQLSNIQNSYKNGWLEISPSEYEKITTELKKQIESQEIELKIKVDPKVEKENDILKKFTELTKPKRQQSSFNQAVSKAYESPTEGMTQMEKNDYALDSINDQMDANDDLIDSLQTLIDLLRELGLVGSDSYNKINERMQAVIADNEKLGSEATDIEKLNKNLKKQEKAWETVGNSISTVGSTLGSLSKVADDDKGLAVAGIIAEAVANVLLGYSQASAQSTSMSPIGWLAFSLSALAATMGMVAQIKSAGAFASGGIVRGGTGAYTDGLTAQVSGGEMILNGSQQNRLWRIISGQDASGSVNGFPAQVDFKIRGDVLYGVLRNFGKLQKALNREIGIG